MDEGGFAEASVDHLQHAVAVLGHVVVVRHHHDRDLRLVRPLGQQLDDLVAATTAEGGRGLVGEHERRLVDEGAGDADALTLAAGELSRTVRCAVRDPHRLLDGREDRLRLGIPLLRRRARGTSSGSPALTTGPCRPARSVLSFEEAATSSEAPNAPPEQRSSTVTKTVAIVTGGSRGIGRAVVERLARRGHVVLTAHRSDHEPISVVGRETSVVHLRCDVTDADAPARILDAAEALGDVTVLVNNAGVTGRIGPLHTADDDEIRRVIDVNLTALIRLTREAVRRWGSSAQRDDRTIVNVSSIAARTGSPGEYVWYAASKAGVEAFTVGLAKEVAPLGIRVNAVSPGTTATGIHARAGQPDRVERIASRTPLGRVATPQEIAAAIEWLTTSDASYVSGAVLPVSGGS